MSGFIKFHVRGEQRGHIMIIIILDQLVDVVLVDVFEDVEADVRDVDLTTHGGVPTENGPANIGL